MNMVTLFRDFAESRQRMSEMTELEVHRDDERPEGEDWLKVEHDPVLRISVWKRTRLVRAAR